MADPATSPPLSRASVQAARALIAPYVHHTPTLTNRTLSLLASTARTREEMLERGGGQWTKVDNPASPKLRLWFKCENLQRVGAFKARGAFHALGRLLGEEGFERGRGWLRILVVSNHAQALSLAAATHNVPAYIVMPEISTPSKVAATKGYGAKVIFSGSTSVEREAAAAKVIEETGARLVPPYDHPDIVLGQGTLGLELQEDAAQMMAEQDQEGGRCSFAAPVTKTGDAAAGSKKRKVGLDAILAPCGGGGMLSGVALSCEGTGIRVFGCEPWYQGADDAKRGYESGRRVESVSTLTVADGLRTPLGRVPWHVLYERKLAGGFYSVSEREICDALRLVLERFKMVVEPSAAVPLAVALYNEDFRGMVEREAGPEGWDVGIVFSGGNVSLEALGKLFADAEEGK
ncbi:pyridoxal-phosphate dependent enzyme [Apiospora rasikravindrae]|uniref:Pyridoxal-phosphate dependent enzyme n=1 Tax=Apiospora rasikravindrae TaxID=990691 RepID=A0ABR1TCF4_9PEZI